MDVIYDGQYVRIGDDVYQYKSYEKKYEGKLCDINFQIIDGRRFETRVSMKENEQVCIPNLGFLREDGTRGNYIVCIRLV